MSIFTIGDLTGSPQAIVVRESEDVSSDIVACDEITGETFLRRAHLPILRAGGAGPLGHLIARQAEAFAADEQIDVRYGSTCARLPPDFINFQHDALACAVALGWHDGVTMEELPLRIEVENGVLHERVDAQGSPTRVVTAIDGARFSEFWLETVTRASSAAMRPKSH